MADQGEDERRVSMQDDESGPGEGVLPTGRADADGETETLIVGIAASPLNIASLTDFFSHVPPGLKAAFIVALQARELASDDEVVQALSQASAGPVAIASSGAALGPGRIYVAPATSLVTLSSGALVVERAPGQAGTIDSFLVSLAEDRRERAVAIVLAGIGGDGTLGATAIKESGGLAFAEAADDSHPHGRLPPQAAAIVDDVLPAGELPARIMLYERHLARLRRSRAFNAETEEVADQLKQIAVVLRNKTGHDFHGYKRNTFLRRVQRRMQVVQAADIDKYVEFLRAEPAEALNLFNDLLIGVTQFFRDSKEFELLQAKVIPPILAGRGRTEAVRVWVLGCATGEEAYSIAILLREAIAQMETPPQVQIFATDIDGRALSSARVGRYTEAAVAGVSPERLARWFVREGNTYCVVKELREMCIFSSHNVLRDAPFSRLDLVSCRNLLIYLDAELQDRVIPLFHFGLRPGGFLFLGNSENVTRHSKLFTPLDRQFRIFRKVEAQQRILPDFPLSAGMERNTGAIGITGRARGADTSLGRRAERIAERYTPAYVIVDEHYELLHFSGRTGRFLDPSSGAASLNLLNLAHRDLRLDLRTALQAAASEAGPVTVERVEMAVDGAIVTVSLVVEPIRLRATEPATFVVIFLEREAGAGAAGRNEPHPALVRDEYVHKLDAELRVARERLQATIEELESTNEELTSSNEEYQSLNEELQSSNEELETSKEELQSVNEELQTVNGELAHRVNELGHANSDLKNLLESTQIATIFLDNEMRIRNFTPAVTDIFSLIDTDQGRPISHIRSSVAYDELQEDARRVLRTLTPVQREVADPRAGTRYVVRVLPYRSIDNFIAGVVLTFHDVTAISRAEQALRESNERYRALVHAISNVVWRTGADGRNDFEVYSVAPGIRDGAGDRWDSLIHPEDRDRAEEEWAAGIASRVPFEIEHRLLNKLGETRFVESRWVPVPDGAVLPREWIGASTDITERKRADQRQKLLLAELQHRVKNMLAVVRSVSQRTLDASSSLEVFSEHFDGRIGALARAQTISTRTPDTTVDLAELVSDEILLHALRDGEQVTIAGPSVRLAPKAAEALALAFHELATNAVKYGALTVPTGRIDIDWHPVQQATGQRLHVSWRETGVTDMDPQPSGRGFGRELIERQLPYELGAETAFRLTPDGIICTIDLPITVAVAMLVPEEEAETERPEVQ